jgi:membrane associated rhomboid family serine protease
MSQSHSRFRFGAPSGGSLSIGPPGPVPPVVKALIVVNIGVHLLTHLTSAEGAIQALALIPPRVLGHFEIWRLVTYQFLHAGAWHVALNMLMLWMFGSELEQRWGGSFFLKYYLVCGLGGGFIYTLVRAGSGDPTVGASGAIFGVLMAYGMWFPNRVVLLGFLFPVRVRHVIVFLIIIELLQGVESTGDGIAHAAHLGGMAFGYAYLRWWGAGGLGGLPTLKSVKRAYYRWRLRRLQRKRFGSGDGNPTFH